MSYPPPAARYPDPNHPVGQPVPGPVHGPPQPVYGPQGQPFGHPHQPPPFVQPPGRRRIGLVVGICAAGIGVLVTVIVLMLTLGGASPTAIAERFIAAAQDGDVDTLQSLTCGALDFEAGDSDVDPGDSAMVEYFSERDFEILSETISGNEAFVMMKVSGPDGDTTWSLKLVDEDGWKVCVEL